MIVKMSRYDFVLMAAQSEDFVARLRELGLVDITTTGWEPREQDRQLVVDIDHYTKTIDKLRDFAESESMQANAEAYQSGVEAFEAYTLTQQRKVTLVSELARLEKMSEDLLYVLLSTSSCASRIPNLTPASNPARSWVRQSAQMG